MIGERPSVDLDLVEVRCSVCGRTTTADEVLAVYDRRAPCEGHRPGVGAVPMSADGWGRDRGRPPGHTPTSRGSSTHGARSVALCPVDQRPLPGPPPTGGRTPRYCSDACRAIARRSRDRVRLLESELADLEATAATRGGGAAWRTYITRQVQATRAALAAARREAS